MNALNQPEDINVKQNRQIILHTCIVVLLINTHLFISRTADDAETLLNWTEQTYLEILPSHQATQNNEPWLFRHYPELYIYADISRNNTGAYVLRSVWEKNLTLINYLSAGIAYSQRRNSLLSSGTVGLDTNARLLQLVTKMY